MFRNSSYLQGAYSRWGEKTHSQETIRHSGSKSQEVVPSQAHSVSREAGLPGVGGGEGWGWGKPWQPQIHVLRSWGPQHGAFEGFWTERSHAEAGL